MNNPSAPRARTTRPDNTEHYINWLLGFKNGVAAGCIRSPQEPSTAHAFSQTAAKLITQVVLPERHHRQAIEAYTAADVGWLASLLTMGCISFAGARSALTDERAWSGAVSPNDLLWDEDLFQRPDAEQDTANACREAINATPSAAAAVRSGNAKAVDVLIGAVLHSSTSLMPAAVRAELLRQLAQ
jgi:Asp-tRNA(Asn)/Glu-tRNA(Gln) amidotransferase B subunit